MQRLIFDYSPFYFALCLVIGFGYAWLLYTARYSWSKSFNRILFALRALLVTLLFMLLLGPVLRQTKNIFEKPTWVFLIDNSKSVKQTTDTTALLSGMRGVAEAVAQQDVDVEWSTLDAVTDSILFDHRTSDLSSSLKQVVVRHEGKNLAGIVLVSDGIYNNGVSPLYQPLRIPVFTVGIGDTVQRADLVLRNVAYNRVVYQGNKYPLRAEVGMSGLPNRDITVTVRNQGKILQKITKNTGDKSLLDFDFQLDAATPGIQRLEIRLDQVANESNLSNNRAAAFVEVVEGKKKILLIAGSPHPDIKALASVVEKNSNYEFLVHLPGIKEQPQSALAGKDLDMVIAHQSPDIDGRTTNLLTGYIKEKVPVLVIVGQRTQLRTLPAAGVPVVFEPSAQRDEVQPVLNSNFQDFGFSMDVGATVARYPPTGVPFGKFTYPTFARTIMFQRIGNLITERPLLMTLDLDGHKLGVVIGEGIWKWRLNESQETGKTIAFDEIFSKLLQYLSTKDDRKKFRSFPLQHEFTSDGPVVMESQVYNDLFQPVYGHTVQIDIRNEEGKSTTYRYVTGPGSSSRYRIGGLAEGIYRYTSTTEINGKREAASGEFLVVEQNQESRNLTADFGLLRKLAKSTDGKFYKSTELNLLGQDLSSLESRTTIHTEETFNPLINLKLVFVLLLALISAEWFLRKFAGAY